MASNQLFPFGDSSRAFPDREPGIRWGKEQMKMAFPPPVMLPHQLYPAEYPFSWVYLAFALCCSDGKGRQMNLASRRCLRAFTGF
ncbi:Hypothetical protein NTJ_13048 [Nesidiocoris tenuis]|uniref:CTNNB1 binding N-teminal domain-containing protein n=1 Tax=Nesidiocoris tenuis TaxID=355587 RepID=A0ABN7BAP8_9HEMI|nr:Hypothetical protein NTJ_13048 [Nesidiocoris tenuis]